MRINETRKVAKLIEGLDGGTSDYSELTNKPSINNVTLSGNKTTAELGINEGTTDYADLSNKPSINGKTLSGEMSTSTLGLLGTEDLMVVLSEDANDAIEAGGTITDVSDVAALNAVKGKYDDGEQLPIYVLAKDSSRWHTTLLHYILLW